MKPFASSLATNLVITTDRRSYHLQLTATSRTAMAALSWTYPADQLIALRKAAEHATAAAPVAEGLAIDSLHFNYVVSGDQPTWRPLRAFDDGRQTFVEFPATIAVEDAPPLFIVGPTGEAVRDEFLADDRAHERKCPGQQAEILVETDLAEDSLVSPIPIPLSSEQAYYLVVPANRSPTPALEDFRWWLPEEVRSTM